jgi:hypothetical protein
VTLKETTGGGQTFREFLETFVLFFKSLDPRILSSGLPLKPEAEIEPHPACHKQEQQIDEDQLQTRRLSHSGVGSA